MMSRTLNLIARFVLLVICVILIGIAFETSVRATTLVIVAWAIEKVISQMAARYRARSG